MAAVERAAADVVSPPAPDLEHVVVQLGKLAAPAPEHEQGAVDVFGAPVRLVVLEVDCHPGAVVLAHGMDRLRVSCEAEVVLESLWREELPSLVALTEVEGVGVGADHPLSQAVGL